MQRNTHTPTITSLSCLTCLTLYLTACPDDMLDDATLTAPTVDSLDSLTLTTLSATGAETETETSGASTSLDATTGLDETADTGTTGPAVVPCDLTPIYVFTAPVAERPWMRALHDGCSVEEIVAGAARWTLENGDTDPPHVSPPGQAPGAFGLDPNPYPNSLDDACVIVMWGLDNKAPIVWSINQDGQPVVQSGFVMNGIPKHPAWLDGDVWRGASLPGDAPTCMPAEI
jgi:hypothetical protein